MWVGRPTVFLVALLSVVIAAVLAATPAWASSPSGVSVEYWKCGQVSCQQVEPTHAGEKVGYIVSFTATSGLSGGAAANDSITISAPAGTVFPAGNEYALTNRTTGDGYGIPDAPVLSDGGSTVTLSLAGNDMIEIPAGDRVEVQMGLLGPTYVTNPSVPGQYTLKLHTSNDTTPATSAPYTIAPENIAPKVTSVVPEEDATGIAPGARINAFFSEAMKHASIDAGSVRLFKVGERSRVDATVTYARLAKKATLVPSAPLQPGAKYRVVVTPEARDKARNRLDQDGDPSNGNQKKQWYFTVSN